METPTVQVSEDVFNKFISIVVEVDMQTWGFGVTNISNKYFGMF